ncbi:MAG: Ureidoglycolate lyase [Alphaproteobacteria bacterium MarineAlpha3_Bin7]|nr:MAG: Ureidoglycolate lyase [Alphaproteobacteria bacterium MarineAlpha3_Bin7]
MKILFFDDFKLGVLNGDQIVDVSSLVEDIPMVGPHDLINGLIANFDAYRDKLEEAAASGAGVPLDSVRLRAPLPRPVNIVCMAVNYMEDGTLPEPAPINAFTKASNSVIGPGDTMVLQDIPATVFEGEAELGVVIGKRCYQVSQEDAMDYVFGYINFIDGSARGLLPPANFFFQMKARESFTPIGPYLVTKDEIDDPQKVPVKLWVNGNLLQNFNTDDMAHSIKRCIEWISHVHTLEPGDIIATGTNHGGLNPFHDGDVVELECEGMGKLSINIQDDLKRTWERTTRLERKNKGLEPPHAPQLSGKYAPEK